MPEIMTPGPDHSITLHRSAGRVRALFHGHLLADSGEAVLVREKDNPDRYYFPREDIQMEVLTANDHATVDPYAGQATYFTIYRDRHVIENFAWSYEQPHSGMEALRGLITFDPKEVDIQLDEESAREVDQRRINDDYILHTDSGSGSSQAQRWEPNVGRAAGVLGDPFDEDRRRP